MSLHKAPSSGVELAEMFKDWGTSCSQSAAITMYDEAVLVDICRNQEVLFQLAIRQTGLASPIRWTPAPASGSQVRALSAGWTSSSGQHATMLTYDEPLIVAILRNQEAILAAIQSSGRDGAELLTKAPASGEELTKMFQDWSPNSTMSVLILKNMEPLLVAILRNQEVLLAAIEGQQGGWSLTKAPATGTELAEQFKNWETSSDMAAVIAANSEPLMAAILANQAVLRDAMVAKWGAELGGENLQFADRDLTPPPQACCMVS